jgi:CxxC motif-containing protein (DUF1111 family)
MRAQGHRGGRPSGRGHAAVRALPATVVLLVGAGCSETDDAALASSARRSPGGITTVEDRTSNAYSLPAPGLSPEELEAHLRGDAAFEAAFVTAPAPVNPGLGPLYNHTSCEGCHGRDGRGLPQLGGSASQALVRVSLPDGIPAVPGGAVEVPGLGAQLQDHAVFGVAPEVRIALAWEASSGRYGDGEAYSLRRPRLTITRGDTGEPLGPEVQTSLRIAPPMFGRGLLEAVEPATLEALAQQQAALGDGIAGQVNVVWDVVQQRAVPGRFGQKASTPTLAQQVAAAYANDMGVSNPMFPERDGGSELAAATLADVTMYSATLGVPAPAPSSPESRRGERLFEELGCARCHVPALTTGAHAVAALAQQEIWPYTDLLLHDLGDGLADGRPDFAASGRQWRTAALWGLGLVPTVTPGAGYLHDGRARTIAEAILWHGGEAAEARERFRLALARDRAALLAFLGSL